MKESYHEELANHMGPESCGGHGGVSAEALIWLCVCQWAKQI